MLSAHESIARDALRYADSFKGSMAAMESAGRLADHYGSIAESASEMVRAAELFRPQENFHEMLGRSLELLRPHDTVTEMMQRTAELYRPQESAIEMMRSAELARPDDSTIEMMRQTSEIARAHEPAMKMFERTESFAQRALLTNYLPERAILKEMRPPSWIAELSRIDEMHTNIASVASQLASIPSFHDSIANQLAEFSTITDRLTDIARLSSELTAPKAVASVLADIQTRLPSIDKLQQLQPSDIDADSLRSAIDTDFVGREEIDRELSSSEFLLLDLNAKLDRLLEMQVGKSSTVRQYISGVFIGVVANQLFALNHWLLFVSALLYFFVDYLRPQEIIKGVRLFLRSSQIVTSDKRIVVRDCRAFYSPKPKSKQIAVLKSGQLVQLTDKFKGWRQVSFFDNNVNETRIGWARSKYLREI